MQNRSLSDAIPSLHSQNDNSARSASLLAEHQKVLAMPELRVEKLGGHLRAEAEYALLMTLRAKQITVALEQECKRTLARLIEFQRAHNVARMNRCTAVYLKPVDLVFRFVGARGQDRPAMRLCSVVGRKYLPLEFGPMVSSSNLHDDALVSAAIWNAVIVAERRAAR